MVECSGRNAEGDHEVEEGAGEGEKGQWDGEGESEVDEETDDSLGVVGEMGVINEPVHLSAP